jgi:chromosome segregation ATPase
LNEHRPEPPFVGYTDKNGNFVAGELTPWQDLSRGLKTLEGSVASLAVVVSDMRTVVNGHTQAIPALQHGAFLKQEHLEKDIRILVDRCGDLQLRDQQITATLEGVDAHLEEVERESTEHTHLFTPEQLRDNELTVKVEQHDEILTALHAQMKELHTTFQASIDKLDAKFDEYMQYVRNVSHTTIAQGTRIAQLETLAGQQRTMIETALQSTREIRETFPEKFS